MKQSFRHLPAVVTKGVVLLFLGVVLAGCATNPVSGGQDLVLMSEAQEIQLGRQQHQKILKQYGRYDAPKLQAMVSRIGQEIAAQSHRPNLKFTFTVLDSPEVNAFALPGGYVYITRGIMAYLNSEEELAGVLGHEIGHVTARHSVRQQTAQTATGLIGVLAAVATGDSGLTQATNYIGTALVSGYGRSHELEADRLGAEYLARIHYDPDFMLTVIAVLKNQELFSQERARATGENAPAAYHGLFASHPENDQRLQEVIKAAKRLQVGEIKHPNPEDYLSLLDGVVFGDSEAQGIVHNNHFYHRSLNLYLGFPEGWQLINQPTRLLAVSADKKQLLQFVLGEEGITRPRTFLQKTFPDLRDGKAYGDHAYTGIAALDSPWGKRPVRVAAVKYAGKVFLVMAVGENGTPDEGFYSTIKSLRGLTTDEQKLATARKIQLIRARRGDTFTDWAERSNIDQFEVSQLRLLNGFYPEGEPQPGQLIKLVQ